MAEFWVSSGHHLTRRNAHRALEVSDELLLAFLARPEILPPLEACSHEKELHTRLLDNPRLGVSKAMLSVIEDEDARENWQFFIQFRDLLLAHKTIEAAYMAAIKSRLTLPPLFYNQMVHLILRNALDGTQDPFILRAAELFFRTQRASFHEEKLLLADEELIVELEEQKQKQMGSSPLTAMFGKAPEQQLDVITIDNEHEYWSCSDAFTFAFAYGSDPRAREALARVIEVWIKHLKGLDIVVTPLSSLEEKDFKWFIGLDSVGTEIGNTLWKVGKIPPDLHARLIGLFSLQVKEKTFPLFLGMEENKLVRLKPQNLIMGLP